MLRKDCENPPTLFDTARLVIHVHWTPRPSGDPSGTRTTPTQTSAGSFRYKGDNDNAKPLNYFQNPSHGVLRFLSEVRACVCTHTHIHLYIHTHHILTPHTYTYVTPHIHTPHTPHTYTKIHTHTKHATHTTHGYTLYIHNTHTIHTHTYIHTPHMNTHHT